MCQRYSCVIILCFIVLPSVFSYPNGAPTNEPSCYGLQPTHSDPITGEQYPNQQGPRPFRIELSTGVYQPCVMPIDCRRAPITVTIRGLSQYFRGFIIQARTTFGGVKSYGQFIPLGNLVSKTIQCQNGQTLTQARNNDRTVVQFQWLPEPNMNEPFKFRATVVQNVQTIYTGIESTEISPPGAARDDKKVSNSINQRQISNNIQNSGPRQMFILTPSPQEPFDYPDNFRNGQGPVPIITIPMSSPQSIGNNRLPFPRSGVGAPISSAIPMSSPQIINNNRLDQTVMRNRLEPVSPQQSVNNNRLLGPGSLSNNILAPSAGGISQTDSQTINSGIKPISRTFQNSPVPQNAGNVMRNENMNQLLSTSSQTMGNNNQQNANNQLNVVSSNFQQPPNSVVKSDISQIITKNQLSRNTSLIDKTINTGFSLQNNVSQPKTDNFPRNVNFVATVVPSGGNSASKFGLNPDTTSTSTVTSTMVTKLNPLFKTTPKPLGMTNSLISNSWRKRTDNEDFGDGLTGSEDRKNSGYRLISSSFIFLLPLLIIVL